MMTLLGKAVLGDFQIKQLMQKINAVSDFVVKDIQTQAVYAFEGYLSQDDTKKALELLNNGVDCPPLNFENARQVVICPRFGTISPWSSKATDIFNNCGIDIDKIEKVVLLYLLGDNIPLRLPAVVENILHDRMTQSLVYDLRDVKALFADKPPMPLTYIDIMKGGKRALIDADKEFGFALSDDDMDYLVKHYNIMARNPTDVELMMFAQANSEHCRHKIFNADWVIDGKPATKSLFKMIKNTYETNPNDVLSAYQDNSAVVKGFDAKCFYATKQDNHYQYGFHEEPVDILLKVETHNHPTAIAPFAGAATGSGGEIRDEGATGRGAKPKAGLTGFSVSHLHLPNLAEKWEKDSKTFGKPDRISSALQIMTEAPLGSAAFSNEFGRPNLTGYFRVFQSADFVSTKTNIMRGYHKPIMIAGGFGNIKRDMVEKNPIKAGDLLIVLGGPAMQIGLGGGAASSVDSGQMNEGLDFASVQRDNAEMERRCQEVIDTCWAMGADNNPIVSIHDVGAGGLSNAMPELVNDHNLGAVLNLRAVPTLESGMSPMAIWSNEAQERYVLAINPSDKALFDEICCRERCPYAVLGTATEIRQLVVNDDLLDDKPVDLPMQVLLGGTPKMKREFRRKTNRLTALQLDDVDIEESVKAVLRHPTVASKSFLISIGDRSITGMVAQEQYVGRYQVPVADCAITATAIGATTGEAIAMGERSPVALIDPKASARLCVAETITNLSSAKIDKLSDITLSANWMAACGDDYEDQSLYDAVYAVGEELCPALGLTIPVGKDSLSMRTNWTDNKTNKSVVSPLSLIITGVAPVSDITQTLTPNLVNTDASLYRLDLSKGQYRLGGSIFAQTLSQLGDTCPDVDNPQDLKALFEFIQTARTQGLIASYHDISDGGLIATVAEMQFTERMAINLILDDDNLLGQLFSEEIGAVIQVFPEHSADLVELAEQLNVADMLSLIGQTFETPLGGADEDFLTISTPSNTYEFARSALQQEWTKVSYAIAKHRDNPVCADEEFGLIDDVDHHGLILSANYDFNQAIEAPYLNSRTVKPKVAILREQGVNGHLEMAAGFVQAGFDAVDVHMSDLMRGRVDLKDFDGLVACGGFSYGDVLGAGSGWANSILFHEKLRDAFIRFFHRPETFSLGVCNGCQMMSQLKSLMVGAEHFPRFVTNKSARFEARTVNVKVERTKSVLLKGMQDSILPIAVAHGEGLVQISDSDLNELNRAGQIALRYVDSTGNPTTTYPLNPNGSKDGITGVCSNDGRVTLMMPHPERTLKAINHAWLPDDFDKKGDGAWLRLFRNARAFLR